jgi:hypothetical protein
MNRRMSSFVEQILSVVSFTRSLNIKFVAVRLTTLCAIAFRLRHIDIRYLVFLPHAHSFLALSRGPESCLLSSQSGDSVHACLWTCRVGGSARCFDCVSEACPEKID